ncbi:hypothetical protein C0J52_05712 [Blattella germanica]|nr:hypothetical protein C0J52_05712 [Blattella germanica]
MFHSYPSTSGGITGGNKQRFNTEEREKTISGKSTMRKSVKSVSKRYDSIDSPDNDDEYKFGQEIATGLRKIEDEERREGAKHDIRGIIFQARFPTNK